MNETKPSPPPSLYIITVIKNNDEDLLRTALSVINHIKNPFIHVFVDASIHPVKDVLNNYKYFH